MKFEKLTDNKIRIILESEELSKNNIELNDILKNTMKSQKFLLDILTKAEQEIGFYTKDSKILIEAFTSIDEVFVFTITKLSNKKSIPHLKIQKKTFTPILTSPIYSFSSFEEFCCLCNALYKSHININNIAKKVCLYCYKNKYYLVFSSINLNYNNLKKFFSVLSEFANIIHKPNGLEARLLEYGKLIVKTNALRTGIKYFVDKS